MKFVLQGLAVPGGEQKSEHWSTMRFGGQRGRMISASDRSKAIELIKEAVINGASETSMQGTRDQSEDAKK